MRITTNCSAFMEKSMWANPLFLIYMVFAFDVADVHQKVALECYQPTTFAKTNTLTLQSTTSAKTNTLTLTTTNTSIVTIHHLCQNIHFEANKQPLLPKLTL